MLKEYKYQCKDYSVITPPFKKFIISPIVSILPWGIPANIITIVSNLFLYYALYLAFFHTADNKLNYIIIPTLVLIYIIGDHIDGMQAKKTGTGSALGEFCDHYLDAFNNGIFLMILFLLFNVTNPWLVAFFLLISYLTHSSVFYEQFKTGWLIFDKFGQLESVLLLVLIMFLGYFEVIYLFFQTPVFKGFTIIESGFIISTLGAIITFIITLKRVKSISKKYIYFLSLFVLTGISSALIFESTMIFAILTLYAGYYIGNLMKGHLIDSIERYPDFIIPLAILFLNYQKYLLKNEMVLALLLTYLFVIIIEQAYRIANPLKQFWVWKNPRH